jgi:pimeloyl-ACP methyl ester carboxylesterase
VKILFTLPLLAGLVLPAAAVQVPSFPPEADLTGKPAGELVTRLGEYDGGPADWGFLLVPENRARPASRLLRLVVVRQRATRDSASVPIFNLVGGPGNSNVWGSGEYAPRFLEHHDIVRVGYRGIDSDVALVCPEFTRALQVERPLSAARLLETRRALRACNDRLRVSGVDLDGYNLAEVVEDIEATRKALGYARIHFLAVSWGTQIAYAYAMRHPDRVERMLLIGAGGRARGFDLWDPGMVDRKLGAYAERWRSDSAAATRTPDLIAAIRGGLAKLPRSWRGVRIDPDKVRLSMWSMLEETASAAQVFDAFAAASHGDDAGLALLSWGYDDHLRRELARRHGPFHGEFFCKTMSSGLDTSRGWIEDMDPPGSIVGSPAAKLLWGAASRGGWPIAVIGEEYRRDADIDVETLVLMGNLDVAAPVEYVREELMPRLRRGRLVVLSDWGHVEFVKGAPQAFEHLAARFLQEGVIDSSRFGPRRIDFTPDTRLGDQARSLFPEATK